MRFCKNCGKELMDEAVLCPGCGCSVEAAVSPKKKVNYEDTVKSSGVFVIIGIILLVLGIFTGLLVSVILGAVLCLAAEIIFVIPNTKLTKAFKKNFENPSDKKAYKAELKKVKAQVKSNNIMYKLSFVFVIIALIAVLVFSLLI